MRFEDLGDWWKVFYASWRGERVGDFFWPIGGIEEGDAVMFMMVRLYGYIVGSHRGFYTGIRRLVGLSV